MSHACDAICGEELCPLALAEPDTRPHYPVLVLRPETITKSPQQGTQIYETFEELLAYVSRPVVEDKKDAEGGITLGLFRDGIRRLTHHVSTRAIGIDYDEGVKSMEEIHTFLSSGLHFVYPTHSSTTAKPKSRAILFLDRDVDRATHKRVMIAIYLLCESRGIILDASAKDATRWWYCPMVRPGNVGQYKVLASASTTPPFPVDKWLAYTDKIEAKRKAKQLEAVSLKPAFTTASPEQHASYVQAALTSARDRVIRASVGARHAELNSQAHSLSRYELGLSHTDIEAALLDAFVAVSGDERRQEGLRTIRDAFQARRRS